MVNHIMTRENDEYACSCGLRWDVKEEDPHNDKGDNDESDRENNKGGRVLQDT